MDDERRVDQRPAADSLAGLWISMESGYDRGIHEGRQTSVRAGQGAEEVVFPLPAPREIRTAGKAEYLFDTEVFELTIYHRVTGQPLRGLPTVTPSRKALTRKAPRWQLSSRKLCR